MVHEQASDTSAHTGGENVDVSTVSAIVNDGKPLDRSVIFRDGDPILERLFADRLEFVGDVPITEQSFRKFIVIAFVHSISRLGELMRLGVSYDI